MGDNDKAALMQQLEVMQMKDSLKYVPSISPSPPRSLTWHENRH